MTRGGRPRPGERGIVTVEFCVGLLLATVLTVALVGTSLLGVVQATAAEASAQLARQAARGDDAALQSARDRVPAGADVVVQRESAGVYAKVTVPVRMFQLGEVDIWAEAWAAYEPGEGR